MSRIEAYNFCIILEWALRILLFSRLWNVNYFISFFHFRAAKNWKNGYSERLENIFEVNIHPLQTRFSPIWKGQKRNLWWCSSLCRGQYRQLIKASISRLKPQEPRKKKESYKFWLYFQLREEIKVSWAQIRI